MGCNVLTLTLLDFRNSNNKTCLGNLQKLCFVFQRLFVSISGLTSCILISVEILDIDIKSLVQNTCYNIFLERSHSKKNVVTVLFISGILKFAGKH